MCILIFDNEYDENKKGGKIHRAKICSVNIVISFCVPVHPKYKMNTVHKDNSSFFEISSKKVRQYGLKWSEVKTYSR